MITTACHVLFPLRLLAQKTMVLTALLFVLCSFAVTSAQLDDCMYQRSLQDGDGRDLSRQNTGGCSFMPNSIKTQIQKTIINSNCGLLSKMKQTIGLCITTEQQLTNLQNMINAHLKRVKNPLQQSQLKTRINEITRLFNSIHQKRVRCEVDLNDFVRKVSTGQITSTTYAHRIVQNMHRRDVVPLNRILVNAHTVIGSVVSLIHNVLGNLNLGSILGNHFGGIHIPFGIPCVSCG